MSFPDSPFELFMPYPPAGDQPVAIEKLVEGVRERVGVPVLIKIAPQQRALHARVRAGGRVEARLAGRQVQHVLCQLALQKAAGIGTGRADQAPVVQAQHTIDKG